MEKMKYRRNDVVMVLKYTVAQLEDVPMVDKYYLNLVGRIVCIDVRREVPKYLIEFDCGYNSRWAYGDDLCYPTVAAKVLYGT
jgi:hypothetical protein